MRYFILLALLFVVSFFFYQDYSNKEMIRVINQPTEREEKARIYLKMVEPTVEVINKLWDPGDEENPAKAASVRGGGVIVEIINIDAQKGTQVLIATCAHLVKIYPGFVLSTITAKSELYGESRYSDIIVVNEGLDIALFRCWFKTDLSIRTATFAKEIPRPLDTIYHYGYPGRSQEGATTQSMLTKGTFSSNKSRFGRVPRAWTTNISIWPGSSGGGVYNESGDLIGLASIIITEAPFYRVHWISGIPHFIDIMDLIESSKEIWRS